jgi:hypothetical protein
MGAGGGMERNKFYCINWRMELQVCTLSKPALNSIRNYFLCVLKPTLYADHVLSNVNNSEYKTRHNKLSGQGFERLRQLPDFVFAHFQVMEL